MDLLKEYGIEPDPRFKIAGKESVIIVVYWVLYAAWTYLFAYLGTLTPPEEYSFILGFPSWYFWACLGAGFVFPIIGIFIATRIDDCPLSPWTDPRVQKERKGGTSA